MPSVPGSQQDRLAEGLAQFALPTSLADNLLAYLALLQRWNRTHNLTAVRDPGEMVTLHLLDSLTVLAHLSENRIADLGSGSGLPGIPLAIAQPGLQVTLIEANGKKCSFLRTVQRELGLENVEVVQSRGEALQPDQPFPAVISRAFSSLADFWRIGFPVIEADGRLLAMKGKVPHEEIAALPDVVIYRVIPLAVPGLDAERHLIELSLPAPS